MALTLRTWSRRELTHCNKNTEWIKTHLLRVADKYVDGHPEISEHLLKIVDAQEKIESAIKQVHDSL